MVDKPPFDFVKASFFLVAGVIAVHLVVVVAGALICMTSLAAGECDPTGRLGEVLAAALAAALAFAGGTLRK